MRVIELLNTLEAIAPSSLSESWDKDGLQIGDPSQQVSEIHIALEAEPDLVEEAPEHSALIVHHPPLYNLESVIDFTTFEGQLVKLCALKGISIIAMHTRFDKVGGGLAHEAAELLGLESIRPLVPQQFEAYKLVTFVPPDSVDVVAEELFSAGAGMIGEYKKCSYRTSGTGTFQGSEDARPAVGEAGRYEKVDELRLEVRVTGSPKKYIDALKKAHPYEEPAFDIYPLLFESTEVGIGRVGRLKSPMLVSALVENINNKLSPQSLRVSGDRNREVTNVAVMPGSGGKLFKEASKQAEVFITSDVKYHTALDAQRLGLVMIDVDHGSIERLFVPALSRMLGNLTKIVKIIAHGEIPKAWMAKGGGGD